MCVGGREGGTYHEVSDDVDVAEIFRVGGHGHDVVDLDDILVADEVLREGGEGGREGCWSQ